MKYPEFRPFTGEQIRAARAIARIEQSVLARAADLSLDTIKRIEGIHGPVEVKARVYRAIIDAFRQYGVELESHGDSGFGVRLSTTPAGLSSDAHLDVPTGPAPAPAPSDAGLSVGSILWDQASSLLPKAGFAAPAPSLMSYWDRDERFRFCNQEFLSWARCAMTDLVGRQMAELFGADLYEAIQAFVRAALAGEPQSFERTIERPDGRRLHFHIHYKPDFDLRGEQLGMWAIATDLTALKEAELQLASAKAVFLAAQRHADKAASVNVQSIADLAGAMRSAGQGAAAGRLN